MADHVDERVGRNTAGLMRFLADVTDAATGQPIIDIRGQTAPRREHRVVLWLDEHPDLWPSRKRQDDGDVLCLPPPRFHPEPGPPARLEGWVDETSPRGADGPEPRLLSASEVAARQRSRDVGSPHADDRDTVAPLPGHVIRDFTRWRDAWRAWAEQHRETKRLQRIYESLEEAAKNISQRDDEYELVLACGLLRGIAPDGRQVFRHLMTEPVLPKIDPVTAEVVVSRTTDRHKLEDRELFFGWDTYHPDRGRDARAAVMEAAAKSSEDEVLAQLVRWLSVCLTQTVELESSDRREDEPTSTLKLSLSRALILRPRNTELLAETYRRLAAELDELDGPVPSALGELIEDNENPAIPREQEGRTAALSVDPLFPLPTNDEQQRVLELLNDRTTVVVQGPPGTGKTHTIANLVSALLADGQRVLVTSQKDQALRVLREKIPAQLRDMCVLLAGGSRNAAIELQRGLNAISEAISSSDTEALASTAADLTQRRNELRRRSEQLNAEIHRLREIENIQHEPVAPSFTRDRYRGVLSEIVRDVQQDAPKYDWFPDSNSELPEQPPLSEGELHELGQLLRTDTPLRRARTRQWIPDHHELPSLATFSELVATAGTAQIDPHQHDSDLAVRLARLDRSTLDRLAELTGRVTATMRRAGIPPDTFAHDDNLTCRILNDRLGGRGGDRWGALMQRRGEVVELQRQLNAAMTDEVVEISGIAARQLGEALGWLRDAKALLASLRDGQQLRRWMPSREQRQAAPFLEAVTVNGRAPSNRADVEAAVARFEIEVSALQLVKAWADVGVKVSDGSLANRLAALADLDTVLCHVADLEDHHDQICALLGDQGIIADLICVAELQQLVATVPTARQYAETVHAQTEIETLRERVRTDAARHRSCPEVATLLNAITRHDTTAFQSALEALHQAAEEQQQAGRLTELAQRLEAAHPPLLAWWRDTADDPMWNERVANMRAAWAWGKARQFVTSWRQADKERTLSDEFTAVENELGRVTAQLAGTKALLACLHRTTDTQARALRSYREHMSHIGAGYGKKVKEFRAAARAAMEKAKMAVPAWVVPLPNLLENLSAERSSFDVIIVDEASQVGMEHLFLLWMAPRVIVVGDDQQCTPSDGRLGLIEPVFAKLHEYLPDVDHDIRLNFTPKSHLYGMLSARARKDTVVRLREHFRCMPEIINWSSRMFYGDGNRPGLIPLRERTAADLDPVRVVYVDGAYTEGRHTNIRNPIEAKELAEALTRCVHDKRYEDKTFGVIVLQGREQVRLLEHEINARLTPEEREGHQIRVGIPSDFQGDERDVMFLSMVVAKPPRARQDTIAQQSFNVAASRAKDQMWLFTSVREDALKPHDIRHSLLTYMQHPPSMYGPSPELDAVSESEPCQPFESLFEQRVFREIRARGYHVVPQYPVGTRTLDLVVVGDGGRIAVECDGHRWHTSTQQVTSDARRDRELRRMGWQVIRIRESEFEFDRQRELTQVWEALDGKGIHPGETPQDSNSTWEPINLLDEDTAARVEVDA